MPLTPELRASYEAVLNDQEAEYGQVQQQVSAGQARLKELHTSMATLRKRLAPDDLSITPSITPSTTPSRPPSKKYQYLSVRWAILDLLADSQPLTTPEIAETLLASGIQTKAANFANNVSAVISTTMKEHPHEEVRQLHDGKWELTAKGRDAIEHIRSLGKFQLAMRGVRQFARF